MNPSLVDIAYALRESETSSMWRIASSTKCNDRQSSRRIWRSCTPFPGSRIANLTGFRRIWKSRRDPTAYQASGTRPPWRVFCFCYPRRYP